MKKFLIIILSFLIAGSVHAATIEGKAKGFENKYIRLYSVDDYISFQEVKLDVVKIDSEGTFKLNAYLPHSSLIKLRIEEKTAELILLPDHNLILELTFNEEENKNKLYDRQLTVNILDNSDAGINKLIWQYQSENAAFLEENHSLLVTKKILPEVYVFQEKITAKYSDGSTYFKNYIEYNLAALEDAVLGSEKKLFQVHINNRAILYNNIAYMNFFTQFYQERFVQISQGKKGFQFLSAVNGTQNYTAMMEIINEHQFINSDTLAQLFAVLGLKEVFGDETFKKPKVLSMLNEVRSRAVNREIENIVDNVIEELTFLRNGEIAPNFSLKDRESTVHHLTDFNGKPTLLFFWSANSNAALRDLDLIEEYQEKYGQKIHLLAINIDDDPTKAFNYLKNNSFSFLVLFKDQQYDLTDKYRLVSGRTYAIVDEEGNIKSYPAKLPEANLEGDLFKMSSKN